ncbi:MAG TPA: hypothetical protein VNK92_07845, partial [Vicinamibacterales bacterium]|nr:hypothetical protein [Vicinamibacterales bacterium]
MREPAVYPALALVAGALAGTQLSGAAVPVCVAVMAAAWIGAFAAFRRGRPMAFASAVLVASGAAGAAFGADALDRAL